jgi:hypothetical protein
MAGFSTAETDYLLNAYFRSGAWVKYTTLVDCTRIRSHGCRAGNRARHRHSRLRQLAIAPLDANFSPPSTVGGKRQTSNAVNIAFGSANRELGQRRQHHARLDLGFGHGRKDDRQWGAGGAENGPLKR